VRGPAALREKCAAEVETADERGCTPGREE
jgi:hypothetical protein